MPRKYEYTSPRKLPANTTMDRRSGASIPVSTRHHYPDSGI